MRAMCSLRCNMRCARTYSGRRRRVRMRRPRRPSPHRQLRPPLSAAIRTHYKRIRRANIRPATYRRLPHRARYHRACVHRPLPQRLRMRVRRPQSATRLPPTRIPRQHRWTKRYRPWRKRQRRLAGMGPPYLDLYADFADGNGAHAARYLPVTLMHDKAVSWLDRAIVDGRVTQGEARLYGWLNEFPFDRGDGAFDVNFHVVDGVLDYAPGWPRLRQIATDVRFIGHSLVLRASAAKAFDSDVIGAEVMVADLAGHPAVVVVNGCARGPTADALRFVAESPLREKFGDYLAGMEASGESRLDLALGLPLAEQPARVQGTLTFANSGLKLRDMDIDISAIDGRLGFYEGGLRGRNLRARLLGQPALVAIRSEDEGTAHATLFEAAGSADAAPLARRFLPPLAPRLEGSAPWRDTKKLKSPQPGGTRLQISSPLTGVAVRQPAPLAK